MGRAHTSPLATMDIHHRLTTRLRPATTTPPAVGKLYTYRFSTRQVADPLERRTRAHVPPRAKEPALDVERLAALAPMFEGTHNFQVRVACFMTALCRSLRGQRPNHPKTHPNKHTHHVVCQDRPPPQAPRRPPPRQAPPQEGHPLPLVRAERAPQRRVHNHRARPQARARRCGQALLHPGPIDDLYYRQWWRAANDVVP